MLGLGRDAHVAFNEPGSRPGDGVRRVALDPSTIAAAAADFGGAERVPREALTTGLRTLLAARELLLIVTGAEKADALHATVEGPMADDSPASLLRSHPCLTILCDRAAAARVHPTAGRDSDHVAIVLGHREPGVSAEHRISAHSRARLARAVRLCRETPVRAVVLTGYTHTDGLSEAEQMAREWPLRDVPVLLEVAGRTTAENASRSLPIVLALGVAARVSVVTSLWSARPLLLRPLSRLRTGRRTVPRAPAGGGRICSPKSSAAWRACPASAGRRWTPSGCRRGRDRQSATPRGPQPAGVSSRAATCSATRRAQASMAGQSRARRAARAACSEHRALHEVARLGRHAPAEHHVLARPQLLDEPFGHGRGRRGGMLLDRAERPTAEQPHGHVAQRTGMAAGEGAGIALPALGVDGAAEHDRSVPGQVVDLGCRPRLRVAAGRAHGRGDALGDLRRR